MEKFIPKYPVPKTPEQELEYLIEATCFVFKEIPFMKSNPLLAIWREGNLNIEWVLKQADLIKARKSDLSAGKRNAIIELVGTAIQQFRKRQAGDIEQPKSTDENAEQ